MLCLGRQTANLFLFCWAVMPSFAEPFTNLGFDSGVTNESKITYSSFGTLRYPYGTGLAANLLPGWTVMISAGATNLASIGNGFFEQATVPGNVLNHAGLMIPGDYLSGDVPRSFEELGKYALILDNSPGFSIGDYKIEVQQRGDVPLGAQWLTWREYDLGPGLVIGINGQSFELNFLNDDTYRDPVDPLYGRRFDISAWAGQTINLAFANGPDPKMYVIDSIAFQVPEPTVVALLISAWLGVIVAPQVKRFRLFGQG